MSQKVYVGAADNPLGAQTYGNASMIDYEERSIGSNGFGVRMTAARTYHNYFTQVMTPGGLDENRLKSGHLPIISVSHPQKVKAGFTYHLFATTTAYDTDAMNMMNRIAAEPYDAAVAGGSTYGGLNQPNVDFTLDHEIDRETPYPGIKLYPGDTPADWIACWRKLWNFWQTAAANAGVPASRVRWNWIITVSNLGTADQFYPGDKYVDVIGFDPYAQSTATSFSALCSAAFAYARKKNKPIGFGEINCQHTGDSVALQNWWIDAGNQINALDLTVEYLCIWPSGPAFNGASYYNYNINKVADTNGHAFPSAHAGFLTMINALGGNAIRSAVGQAKPGQVTGLNVVPATNGLTAAATWSPSAGGDNVTSYNIYLAFGNVTSGGVKIGSVNSPTIAFTIPNTTPGDGYTAWVSPVNVTGEGPLSAPFVFQEPIPTSGQNPTISTTSVLVDTNNPQQINFLASASSPLGRTLSYAWTVNNGLGVQVDSFAGSSVSRTYTTQDNYTWSLDVFDNGTPALHGAPVTGSVQLILNSTTTPLCGYGLANFQPGVFVELIGQGLIPIFTRQDTQIGRLLAFPGNVAEVLGACGTTFDPSYGSTSNTCNLGSGVLVWAKVFCKSPTLSSIDTITTQAQIGTGSMVAVCDGDFNVVTVDGTSAGGLAIFSGSNVDAWLTAAAGDTPYELDTAVSGLDPYGQDVIIAVFSPAATVTQYAKFLGAPGPNNAAIANGNAATPLFGSLTGQTTIPTPLLSGGAPAVGSYVACPKPYFAINA